MSAYGDFFPQLALAVALLLTALAAVSLFQRIRLPSPAAVLAVGVAAGLLGFAPTGELKIVTLEQIGAVALFVILFQGGLEGAVPLLLPPTRRWRAATRRAR